MTQEGPHLNDLAVHSPFSESELTLPIIMVEGSDGTGKSTLAERCVDKFRDAGFKDVRLLHFSVPKYGVRRGMTYGEEAMAILTDPLQRIKPDTAVVLDRFHWGEPVYAPIFRGDDCCHPVYGTLEPREFQVVHEWLVKVGTVQVYCRNDPRTVLRRLGARDDWLLSKSPAERKHQVETISKRYMQLILDVERRTRTPAGRTHVARMGGRGDGFWPWVVSMSRPSDTERWASILVDRATFAARRFVAPPKFNSRTQYKRGAWKP